jgi:VCBS repeat protein
VSNLHVADFNNNGRPDLLLTGTGTAIVFGNGDGTFSAPRHVPIPVGSVAGANCTSADLNKDGNQDVLVPGAGGLGVALGNGDGTFQPGILYHMNFDSPYVITGDFNNDGKLDAIASVNSSTSANVFLGNGDGTFQLPLSTIPIPFGAQIGDFNNDGNLDLVMQTAQQRRDGSNFAIAIALGSGNGQFSPYSKLRLPAVLLQPRCQRFRSGRQARYRCLHDGHGFSPGVRWAWGWHSGACAV